ncbi:MAG: 23S rRNA (guanosine(2251)-2'-O)-methyltransferase RlmB [Spirochaetes bacterium]|nr:23S rRNA (guanosine(2251)-2'-O)-methyltransferase RlmB [Spirochaetota bacterium]
MEEKIIFGRNPVLEYLKADPQEIHSLSIAENIHGKIIDDIGFLAKKNNIRIIRTSRKEMDKITDELNHQGVILRLKTSAKKTSDYRDLIEDAVSKKGVIVFLDQLTDPQNIGSIIRNAEALGAIGVVMPKANTPDINSTIVKTSAGATAYIPIVKVSNGAQFLEECRKNYIWVIGSSDKATTEITRIREYRPAVLVIGNEGSGMRRLTGEKCDITVRIEMRGKISSLNAAVASGILLHEILKD